MVRNWCGTKLFVSVQHKMLLPCHQYTRNGQQGGPKPYTAQKLFVPPPVPCGRGGLKNDSHKGKNTYPHNTIGKKMMPMGMISQYKIPHNAGQACQKIRIYPGAFTHPSPKGTEKPDKQPDHQRHGIGFVCIMVPVKIYCVEPVPKLKDFFPLGAQPEKHFIHGIFKNIPAKNQRGQPPLHYPHKGIPHNPGCSRENHSCEIYQSRFMTRAVPGHRLFLPVPAQNRPPEQRNPPGQKRISQQVKITGQHPHGNKEIHIA